MLGWVVRMTMAGVDNARRLSWDIQIIVAFGIIRQNYFRDMDSWLVKPMNRDYLVFLGVFCVVEEMFRMHNILVWVVVQFWSRWRFLVVLAKVFGIAILGVEIMVTFYPVYLLSKQLSSYTIYRLQSVDEMVWMYLQGIMSGGIDLVT